MTSIADSIKLRQGRRQSSGNSTQPDYTGHPLDCASEHDADTIVVRTRAAMKAKVSASGSGAKAGPGSASKSASSARGVQKQKTAAKASRKQDTETRPAAEERTASARSRIAKKRNVGQTIKSSVSNSSGFQSSKPNSAISEKSGTASKRIRLNDDGNEFSPDLSELGETPEPPASLDAMNSGQASGSFELFNVTTLEKDTATAKAHTSTAAPVYSAVAHATTLAMIGFPTPPAATEKRSKIVLLRVPNVAAQIQAILASSPSPKASLPAGQRPERSIKKPVVFGHDQSPTEAVAAEENDDADDVDEAEAAADSQTATKASRKRRAVNPKPAPRKRPATSKKPSSRRKISPDEIVPETEAPLSASKAAESLPSPAASPSSQVDFLESIDPELLKFSRSLTYREPLESKPLPIGKPEVWAPGRQELCETLPYFKAAHSGCYANNGNIYAFMFDSVGTNREYMDQDVIIARMGGNMVSDSRTGTMYQNRDHDINDMQPQSVLNNMAQRNPLVIICGSQNQGAVTKMPHRYCVLDWFKPTHVWGEMTMGKKGPVKTIRYRFERLDRSKPSWYSSSSPPVTELDMSSSPVFETQQCTACGQTCPRVYLLGWMCTNPECSEMWKLSNGQQAPCGDLDYHPAFLLHRTPWERDDPPYSLGPGLPEIGQHFGDNLSYVATRGVVCPDCGRCNTRYLFTGWRCDTQGCKWKLIPEHRIVMPANLHHAPWDITSEGPSLIRAISKPAVNTQVKYFHNYKVVRYTLDGIDGSVIVAKANRKVVSEPGGPDDMFRELQSVDLDLERRMLRKATDVEVPQQREEPTKPLEDDAEPNDDADGDDDHHHKAEVGARMTAFGMNFGMPYKFIASGDSKPFSAAPTAIRSARSRLNWAQSVFVNDPTGYQDFNEELVFAYLEDQKIKYHDDGEKGLGPRIATLSLGAAATMSLRVKDKYFSQVSNTGVFTDEPPLPLPLLKSSGYASGYKTKTRSPALQASAKPSADTHAGRLLAHAELQSLREAGNMETFRQRSKELPRELGLRRKHAETILSFHLTHGDIVIMQGEQIQKFLEHSVEPHGNLRFALTCRTVLPGHLTREQMPEYEVEVDREGYDGGGVREEGDGEAVVW